jgi:hypothetical protein
MKTMTLAEYAAYDDPIEEIQATVWLNCPRTAARIPVAFVSEDSHHLQNLEVWVYDASDNEVLWGAFPIGLELEVDEDEMS